MVRTIALLLALAALAALSAWAAWGNTALMCRTVTVASTRLPKRFSGFRIAQVSDLHNAQFGAGNATLLDLLAESGPDLIVLTGDLVDSRRTDGETALSFAARAAEIAPVYCVPGNHEARLPEAYPALERRLEEAGVHVLRNEAERVERGGDALQLIGIDDPDFATWNADGAPEREALLAQLEALRDPEAFSILLSHRPEFFAVYAQAGIDLTFTGHAHGGQVRLPVVGGLFAPGQGLFPRYDGGRYTSGEASMVVSRGLGNSVFPLRCNNRPELVVVELTG